MNTPYFVETVSKSYSVGDNLENVNRSLIIKFDKEVYEKYNEVEISISHKVKVSEKEDVNFSSNIMINSDKMILIIEYLQDILKQYADVKADEK